MSPQYLISTSRIYRLRWALHCFGHELINYIDTKIKWCHLKTLTGKRTLRQAFIRVYRLEQWDTVSHVGIFDPALWTVVALPFSLVQLISFLLPCVHKDSILYTRIPCVRGGYGVLGLRQINTCRKIPLQVNFFRWLHFALPSMSLIFLRFRWTRMLTSKEKK